MYRAGKLISRSDLFSICIAYHHQNLSSDSSALLQLQLTLAFSFSLDFWIFYWFLNALYTEK